MSQPLLEIDQLRVRYRLGRDRFVDVLQDVSLEVEPGQILGIVGESGSGKSTLGLALPRLLPANGEISGGRVLFKGRDVGALKADDLRALRGAGIGMIFQDPSASLNPTYRIGTQLVDAQRAHLGSRRRSPSKRELRRRAIDMLAEVGIADPDRRIDEFPHQFSGGMLQRVMIALVALLRPAVVIADEPTSALDVTLEVQILKLLDRLRRETGTSILLITHDLVVVSEICTDVVVMYAGRAVEYASAPQLFAQPRHPYTRALMNAIPSRQRRGRPLESIGGGPPRLTELPPGCKFSPRCAHAAAVCTAAEPALVGAASERVRCLIHDPESGHPEAGHARAARPFA